MLVAKIMKVIMIKLHLAEVGQITVDMIVPRMDLALLE